MEKREMRIARTVADGIFAKVTANPQDYHNEYNPLGDAENIVLMEIQDLFPDASCARMDMIVASIIGLEVITEMIGFARNHVQDWASDQAAWARGPMSYYGMREADFR